MADEPTGDAGPLPTSLQSRALFTAVAEQIRTRIFSRVLQPGETIDEMALVRELDVSRTPVREALKVLHNEGLVTLRNRRGVFVATLSPAEIAEAIALHRLLRTHAAGKASSLDGQPAPGTLHARLLALVEQQLCLAFGAEGFAQRFGTGAASGAEPEIRQPPAQSKRPASAAGRRAAEFGSAPPLP